LGKKKELSPDLDQDPKAAQNESGKGTSVSGRAAVQGQRLRRGEKERGSHWGVRK